MRPQHGTPKFRTADTRDRKRTPAARQRTLARKRARAAKKGRA